MHVKLIYFRHDPPNFGMRSTASSGRPAAGGVSRRGEDELFFGAGSILKARPDLPGLKHVAGSGYGGYSAPPDLRDGSWNILWLRGPLTAETAGRRPGPRDLRCRDPAARDPAAGALRPGTGIAFMPHFESAARGDWAAVCAAAGITYLDPRGGYRRAPRAIRGAEVVLTEAMHGAIIADALRTPWVPLLPIHPSHRMKWTDWAASLT
jgi:succinoglycan biosynthesis protein ExoV